MLVYVQILIALVITALGFLLFHRLSKKEDEKAGLIGGFAIGGLALAGSFFCAWSISPDKDPSMDFLLFIAGGTMGWLVGLLLSPSKGEKGEFREWGRAIVTFLSGAVACKFADPLANLILQKYLTRVQLGEALVFIDAFLICMVMVFVARRYWNISPPQEPKKTQAQQISAQPPEGGDPHTSFKKP
jgi:MFS family permease